MEEHNAYPPSQPITYAAHQPNYGTISTQEGEPLPNSTPAAVHVDSSRGHTPSAYNTQYPPVNMEPPQGWLEHMKINKPQMNSAGSALLVLMTGGMSIAWSAGFAEVNGFLADTHIMICWYIAAIIGALISALITNRMTCKPIYLFSGFLVLIGGILFVAFPDEYRGIAAARYLNGFAVGIVIVPMMVLIGEEVVPRNRGLSAALLETGSFAFGIFLQIIFYTSYSTPSNHSSFNSTQMHGIIAIIYALLTCLLSYFLVIESPVYHLQRSSEHDAIDCLRRLQRPFVVTQETNEQLEEHKRYISENDSSDLGLPALVKICLLRGLGALSFSPVVFGGLATASLMSEGPNATWPLVIFGIFTWLGTYIVSLIMDVVGRKRIILSGALICGVTAITIGGIYNEPTNLFSTSKMSSVIYMLFVVQFFAGFFNSTASVYMTEAFPLHLKTYYIAVSFIVQMLVWLIIGTCSTDPSSLGPYFITFGVFYVIVFGLSFIFLPETKYDTLCQAQEKFKNILNGW